MMHVDNLRLVYVSSAELHKVHTQYQKCNMDKNKLGVVEFLDKDEVACYDDDVVEFLYEGMLA